MQKNVSKNVGKLGVEYSFHLKFFPELSGQRYNILQLPLSDYQPEEQRKKSYSGIEPET
jgi:hypothetical protein